MFATLLAALFALGLGIALLLWGYRIFMVLLPIFGFFAGLWLGAQAVSLIFGEGFLASVTGLVVGFFAGLICALFSYLFYAFGVALVAAIIGGSLAIGLLQAIGISSNLILIPVAIVAGIAVALVVMLFNVQKYVIIALTAIAGANALVLAPLLVFGRVSLEELQGAGNAIRPVLADSWIWLVVWIAIAAAGIFYQIRSNRPWSWDPDRYAEGWGLARTNFYLETTPETR